MPKTRYTDFCNQSFDLVCRIGTYAQERVRPTLGGLREERSSRDAKRDVVVYSTYTTIVAWLRTFETLRHSYDFQAIGSGARAIFERFLDLKWLQQFTGHEWLDRYLNFPNVDRYLAAEKVIEHVKTGANSAIDTTPYEQFLAKIEQREPVETLVKRIWGADQKGKPCWPKAHWTGIHQLSERARHLGPDALDAYRQLYSPMSWLVHSGPTAFLNRDFEHLEIQIAWCYFYTFQHSRAATIVAVDLLRVESRIEGFAEFMKQLWRWSEDALATLPSQLSPS